MNLNIYAGRDAQGQNISVNETVALKDCQSEVELLKVRIDGLLTLVEQKDQQIADLRRTIELLTKLK